MYRNISAPIEQAFFEFLEKQTLAASGRERGIQDPIAFGSHRDQLNGNIAMLPAQPVTNIVCLPEREWTFTCGNAYCGHKSYVSDASLHIAPRRPTSYFCQATWRIECRYFMEDTPRVSPVQTMHRGGAIPALTRSGTP
jgi:hypothetical protein